METLNFNENCILGNSELIPWNKSLRQDFSSLLYNMGASLNKSCKFIANEKILMIDVDSPRPTRDRQ